MNRRDFLRGCASFAALAAVRGFGITNLLFDSQLPKAHAAILNPQQPPPNNRDLLVLVFVRGGLDGLNVLVPFNTSPTDRYRYYNVLRPTLHVPAPNDANATRKAIDLDGRFGLHPDAARGAQGVNVPNGHVSDTGGLYELYRRGDLAIIHAAGSPDVTGSHFDSELYMDLGASIIRVDGWHATSTPSANPPTRLQLRHSGRSRPPCSHSQGALCSLPPAHAISAHSGAQTHLCLTRSALRS